VPAAAHISKNNVETQRMQSLQMLPAHFHTYTIQVFSLHARTQKEQAVAAAVAQEAVVSECSVRFFFPSSIVSS